MNIKKGEIEKMNWKNLSYTSVDWVTPLGHPNFQFFSTNFGDSKVQVADCDTREFTDQKREEMLVSEFIGRCLQDVEGSAVQCSNSHSEYPEYVAYKTPIFFCDDWLNLYLDNYRMHTDSDKYQENNEICCSDYRFVYMGVKGSWTPLHADVFRSYSWSANVCGKKRWLFLDPSQHHLVFDRNMKNCVYNIFDEVSDSKFPGFKKAIWLECMQEAGEIIFVPSGWYHQVQNLVCPSFLWMNFYDFFTFISRFTLANIVLLCYINGRHGNITQISSTIAQHLLMNLGSIRKVASEMKDRHALKGNQDRAVDIIETLEDPRFCKLCMDIGRTYAMIHEESHLSFDFESASAGEIADLTVLKAHTSSQFYTPEDLVEFIDNAVAEHGDCYINSSVI
ncbi:hypothetical protein AAHE18_08G246300 [Arachis hypogaea]